MAVTPPLAAVAGKVKATDINTIGSVLTVANTYSPTVSNWASATVGPTTTGRYWITGNICNVFVQTKLGTGTITVAGVTITLPFPMDTTGMILQSSALNGASSFNDVSASSWFAGFVRVLDANTIAPMRPSGTTAGLYGTVTASLPFVWATLDEMNVFFSYPIA